MSTAPLPMLCAVREHYGLSHKDLADKAGVSVTTIINAERDRYGRGIKLDTAKRISAALEVSLDLLCGVTAEQMIQQRRKEIGELLDGYKALPFRAKRGGKRTKTEEVSDGG